MHSAEDVTISGNDVVAPPLKREYATEKEQIDISEKKTPIIRSGSVSSDRKPQINLERFIGENLINKIGIIVTVIGVAIGAKYAIDYDLINPLTRIIIGYMVGAGLLYFALKLRNKFENFSAVLLSGSMAIMYLITYIAYSFYSLFPQLAAFSLMVIFTVFTVTAALKYDREIISIIGLVGAYAVPFLLSDNSENAAILFVYTSIINIGILIIAIKKYWKPLYISAFILSWMIYFTWFLGSYKDDKNIALASIFLFLFFVIFYITFLSYKLIKKERFGIFDIILLLCNSFIFYGVAYHILKGETNGDKFLGLLTLGNALIHLIVSFVIYRNKLADRNLFYLVSGLFLVFIAIGIPVQLDGNWVTLLWIGQAALLFYIGRTRSAPVYEYISYSLLVLSFLSIAQDWGSFQVKAKDTAIVNPLKPVFNIFFFSSVLYVGVFAAILRLFFSKKYISPLKKEDSLQELLDYGLPVLFIIAVYFTFSSEISAFWNHRIALSGTEIPGLAHDGNYFTNTDLFKYKMIWQVNYSLFFFAVLTLFNLKCMNNKVLNIVVFWVSFITMFIFLFQSLYLFSELRESFLNQSQTDIYSHTSFNIAIRYISFIFVAISMSSLYICIRRNKHSDYFKIIFNLLFHLTLLWILSSEMLNIMDLTGNEYSYRFGLSILAGLYAFLLIVLGISGRKKYLRIAAMVLFGATLAKLFFYDITRLDIILKTILFVALGILMLVISYLYNKYKKRMFEEPEEKT